MPQQAGFPNDSGETLKPRGAKSGKLNFGKPQVKTTFDVTVSSEHKTKLHASITVPARASDPSYDILDRLLMMLDLLEPS